MYDACVVCRFIILEADEAWKATQEILIQVIDISIQSIHSKFMELE